MKPPIEMMLDKVEWKPIIRDADFVPGDIPYATHSGILKIGDCELECVVLNTGMRLITEDGFRNLFGSAWDELKEAATLKAEGKEGK